MTAAYSLKQVNNPWSIPARALAPLLSTAASPCRDAKLRFLVCRPGRPGLAGAAPGHAPAAAGLRWRCTGLTDSFASDASLLWAGLHPPDSQIRRVSENPMMRLDMEVSSTSSGGSISRGIQVQVPRRHILPCKSQNLGATMYHVRKAGAAHTSLWRSCCWRGGPSPL